MKGQPTVSSERKYLLSSTKKYVKENIKNIFQICSNNVNNERHKMPKVKNDAR